MVWWRSINLRLGRYFQLSTAERAVLWRVWLLLPAASALLRIRGLERGQEGTIKLARVLGLGPKTGLGTERVRLLVGRAARMRPRASRCLAQSVVTRACLPKLALEIGVRRRAGGLEAHAWVEHGGEPVGERGDVTANFAPLGLSRDSEVAGRSKRVVE